MVQTRQGVLPLVVVVSYHAIPSVAQDRQQDMVPLCGNNYLWIWNPEFFLPMQPSSSTKVLDFSTRFRFLLFSPLKLWKTRGYNIKVTNKTTKKNRSLIYNKQSLVLHDGNWTRNSIHFLLEDQPFHTDKLWSLYMPAWCFIAYEKKSNILSKNLCSFSILLLSGAGTMG